MTKTLALFSIALLTCAVARADEPLCTYNGWTGKKARVQKPYAKLSKQERDPSSPCTVCEEDQTWIEMKGVPRFRICKHFSNDIQRALTEAMAQGYKIQSVSGYRVDYAKGSLIPPRRRTLSYHSYGTAIDINPERNGHYTHCKTFNRKCKLIGGGAWDPKHPLSITPASPIYRAFKKIDWAWSGELPNGQKDFMHFSLSGR